MSTSVTGGFWPTDDQLRLLKAALFPATDALRCWQDWTARHPAVQFPSHPNELLPGLHDPLDPGSQRLLPMIYRNLQTSDDPIVPLLKGVYRYTWLHNQQLLHQAGELVGGLQRAGIEVLLLKGIPLALTAYRDVGVRFMNDVDLLVKPEHRDRALEVLQTQFGCTLPYAQGLTPLDRAVHLVSRRGVNLDLHWHLFPEHLRAGAEEPFWAARRPLPLGSLDGPAHTLSPTHQLFFTIVSNGRWDPDVHPVRWVGDCYALYAKATEPLDWPELFRLAETYRYVLPLKRSLELLSREFRLNLPADPQRQLDALTFSPTEERYYTLMSRPPRGKHLGWYLRHKYLLYHGYHRAFTRQGFLRWMLGRWRVRLA